MLALVLALGVQVSWTNPAASGAELRAMACCAEHSDRPMSLPEQRACCGVTLAASGPAENPVAGLLATVAVPQGSPLAPPAPPNAAVVAPEPSPAGIGPPAFLAHRHLLI